MSALNHASGPATPEEAAMDEDAVERHLIAAACAFWFHDNDRVRSPFPVHIQEVLRANAERAYLEWLGHLGEPGRELDAEELASFFEYFLFREALALVGDEDSELVLTLHHPFMPRVGDRVQDAARGACTVVGRRLEQRDDDKLYMIMTVEAEGSAEPWQTEFLIPT